MDRKSTASLLIEQKFNKIDNDGSGQLTAVKLQRALTNGTSRPFNLDTCRLLVVQFDTLRNGYVGYEDFKALWNHVNDWKYDFVKLSENLGFLSMRQLQNALAQYGFNFTTPFFQILLRRFDRTRTGRFFLSIFDFVTFSCCLLFDDFMHMCIMLQRLMPSFRTVDVCATGRINIRKILSHITHKMNCLKRFEIAASPKKRVSEEFPTVLKHLRDLKNFNAPGVFYANAKVTDLQFSLYKACPLKNRGMLCKKKLDDDSFCGICMHRANRPLRGLYMRLELHDCGDMEISQHATMFASVAESYLDMKVDQFADMVEQRPEKVEAMLESKIGQIVCVKLTLKAKGEHGLLDWVISALIEGEKMQMEEPTVTNNGQFGDGDGAEDGEIIALDSSDNAFAPLGGGPPKKRAKKN